MLALLLVLHTRNDRDGNKLVIFSGIALYYGDTCIVRSWHSQKPPEAVTEHVLSWESEGFPVRSQDTLTTLGQYTDGHMHTVPLVRVSRDLKIL